MNLYSDYLRETGLKGMVEHSWGFATYHINGQECYIEDIYVTPEERKNSRARELADQIAAEAKAAGCKYLTGSVNTSIKDPTTSMKVLLAYGFKFLRSEPRIVWFCKEIA